MIRMLTSHQNRERDASIALFDTGYSYLIQLATLDLERRQTIHELEYEGLDDRLAARAMAHGAFASIRRQIADGIIEA